MILFLPILSAIFLTLAFPKPGIAIFAWFALVPWLFALKRQKNPRSAFLLSYLVGLVFFSLTLYWINYVSTLGFVVLMCYLAFYFAAFGIFIFAFKRFRLLNLVFIPAAWVVLEFVRGHLPILGFNWALLAYSQYLVLPIIQISDITGAYGVSFLIVLVNVGIYQTVSLVLENKGQRTEKRFARSIFVLCAFLPVLFSLAYGYFKLFHPIEGQSVKVAVIQGNIPQVQKWDPRFRESILAKYRRLTKEAAFNKPDIIIWPETSVPGFLESEPELLEEISSLSKSIAPSYLLLGTPHEAEGSKIHNSATLLSSGEILQRYDKLRLVPFGEFIPWPEFFSRFSFAGLIGNFSRGDEYTIFGVVPGVRCNALICFEDVFSDLVRIFVSRGANLAVNMTNDAWFGSSAEPYQHLQSSIFRAVENRVSVVRSANTGVSCFIDPRGRILKRVDDYLGRDIVTEGWASEDLKIGSMPSFYTKHGDIFVYFCIAITLLATTTALSTGFRKYM